MTLPEPRVQIVFSIASVQIEAIVITSIGSTVEPQAAFGPGDEFSE
jgi:hypothetical protein